MRLERDAVSTLSHFTGLCGGCQVSHLWSRSSSMTRCVVSTCVGIQEAGWSRKHTTKLRQDKARVQVKMGPWTLVKMVVLS